MTFPFTAIGAPRATTRKPALFAIGRARSFPLVGFFGKVPTTGPDWPTAITSPPSPCRHRTARSGSSRPAPRRAAVGTPATRPSAPPGPSSTRRESRPRSRRRPLRVHGSAHPMSGSSSSPSLKRLVKFMQTTSVSSTICFLAVELPQLLQRSLTHRRGAARPLGEETRWRRRESKVGAPSTQRPYNSGQGDIRSHPPVEPARDQCRHGVSVDRSDGRGAGQRGIGPRRWRRAWRDDRAVRRSA